MDTSVSSAGIVAAFPIVLVFSVLDGLLVLVGLLDLVGLVPTGQLDESSLTVRASCFPSLTLLSLAF